MVYSLDDSWGYRISIHSFFWACLDCSKNSIYFSLATWHFLRHVIEYEYPKKSSCNWVRSSESIPNDTSPSSRASDCHKTKIIVSELDGTPREPVLMRKIFRVRSRWRFHPKCSFCRRVHPENFCFHVVREIFTNYFPIN